MGGLGLIWSAEPHHRKMIFKQFDFNISTKRIRLTDDKVEGEAAMEELIDLRQVVSAVWQHGRTTWPQVALRYSM